MTTARITDQAPILFVSDLPASVDYWRDRVGFVVGGIFGEPRPEFAILRRDRAFIMLSQAPDGHTIVPSWRIKDKTWNAYFWVDDAEAMFNELKERGAHIDYDLCRQPYNVLEFGIQDLDDQDVAFGQVLGDRA